MKIRIIRFGKPAFDDYRSMVDVYVKRLRPFAQVSSVELKLKPQHKDDIEFFLESCCGDARERSHQLAVVFDERGAELSSKSFAELIQKATRDSHYKTLNLIIGPPYGFPEGLLSHVDKSFRLSGCTLTSDFAWLLLWEQVYRAFSIINGTQYHHE